MEKSSTDVPFVRENLCRIEETVQRACREAGRSRDEVTLMAVTKTVDADRINTALRAGITCIGENRVQEYLGKKDSLLLSGVQRHLIGHLQTNKVRQIVGEVDMIQSVDSLRLATAIDRCSAEKGLCTDVLLEVNIGGEDSKSGVAPQELPMLLEQVRDLPCVKVRGLMCIPPVCDAEKQRRQYFSQMYQLFIDIWSKNVDNKEKGILSMGMSADFREAILEGSTMIRVGTALFGQRQYI